MSIGLLGKKLGMTRVYDTKGTAVAVTVIHVEGNTILQKKTTTTDGYSAVQVGYGEQKEHRVTKGELGHFKKAGSTPKRYLHEFRVKDDAAVAEKETHPGVEIFQVGDWVDVIGVSKGRGFTGTMKRFNFHGQPDSHGSMMHRRPGSIGCRLTPGRVWKNKKMPGHFGCDNVTVQNLKVVQVRPEDGVILISGGVPGANDGHLIIRPAKKKAHLKK